VTNRDTRIINVTYLDLNFKKRSNVSFNKFAVVNTAIKLVEFQVSANITVRKINLCYCLIALRDTKSMTFNFCADTRMKIYFRLFDGQEHFRVLLQL
jgi:alpha-glucuronidase